MSPRTYEEELTDYERSGSAAADDHELTLSTPTILGLFFGLVIVCGCFFGLGYAMGHRTVPAPQVFDNSTAVANGAAKPAAGSTAQADPSSLPDASAASPADTVATSSAQTTTVPLNATATVAPTAAALAASTTTSPAATSTSAAARPTVSTPTAQPAAPLALGSFVVQVAAVSSQDVANILLTTLQKKGYAVVARHEQQDQLLHIQIGPFTDRKDADAMRQRVINDGFNAIVK